MHVLELSRLDARRVAVCAQLLDSALPILYSDRLVGKLDATADREAGVLRVDAIHQDVAFNKTVATAVDSESRDLAHRLGLDLALPG